MPRRRTRGRPRQPQNHQPRVFLPRRELPLNPTPGQKILARGKTWTWPHWPCVITHVHPYDHLACMQRLTVHFYPDNTSAIVDAADCLHFNDQQVDLVVAYARSKQRTRKDIKPLLYAVDMARNDVVDDSIPLHPPNDKVDGGQEEDKMKVDDAIDSKHVQETTQSTGMVVLDNKQTMQEQHTVSQPVDHLKIKQQTPLDIPTSSQVVNQMKPKEQAPPQQHTSPLLVHHIKTKEQTPAKPPTSQGVNLMITKEQAPQQKNTRPQLVNQVKSKEQAPREQCAAPQLVNQVKIKEQPTAPKVVNQEKTKEQAPQEQSTSPGLVNKTIINKQAPQEKQSFSQIVAKMITIKTPVVKQHHTSPVTTNKPTIDAPIPQKNHSLQNPIEKKISNVQENPPQTKHDKSVPKQTPIVDHHKNGAEKDVMLLDINKSLQSTFRKDLETESPTAIIPHQTPPTIALENPRKRVRPFLYAKPSNEINDDETNRTQDNEEEEDEDEQAPQKKNKPTTASSEAHDRDNWSENRSTVVTSSARPKPPVVLQVDDSRKAKRRPFKKRRFGYASNHHAQLAQSPSLPTENNKPNWQVDTNVQRVFPNKSA